MIRNHQRYGQTDRQTDVKRSHDRYIAKACSGKNAIACSGRRFCRQRLYVVVAISEGETVENLSQTTIYSTNYTISYKTSAASRRRLKTRVPGSQAVRAG